SVRQKVDVGPKFVGRGLGLTLLLFGVHFGRQRLVALFTRRHVDERGGVPVGRVFCDDASRHHLAVSTVTTHHHDVVRTFCHRLIPPFGSRFLRRCKCSFPTKSTL